MSNLNIPNREENQSFLAYYTGKNQHATSGSRSALDLNLAVGMIVQKDAHEHEAAAGTLSPARLTVAGPTAGFMGDLYVVTEILDRDLNTIPNSAAPTQRKGGMVRLVKLSGRVKCLVNGTLVAGQTLLAPSATTLRLVPTSPTTVAHLLTRVGNNARPCAIALEALTSGDGAKYVSFNGATLPG